MLSKEMTFSLMSLAVKLISDKGVNLGFLS